LDKLKSISAFFPAYNEEANVDRMIDAFRSVLPQVAEDYEIIIVNDGSKDRTREIADRLVREDQKVRAVHHETNQGYGAAVRSGIKACIKEYLFFTDGDGQFDVSQLSNLVPLLSGYDGVIGFRLNRQDPWVRKLNAWAWNRLVRLMFGLKVKDIDCAFKLFHRRVFKDIELESSGAMISTEMLVKIKDKGFKLQEMGVLHSPRLAGKQTGANIRVILRAFKELFRFYGRLKEAKR
jgi:glycosyltransferase involved in cell wall biosynthesis